MPVKYYGDALSMTAKDNFVHLTNPGKENSSYLDDLQKILNNVLQQGQYILGQQVKSFEKNFANYCRAKHCVSTANGTDAI